MKLIPFSALVVPENRQRREFDPKRIAELASSISTKGLFHPIVVTEEGDKYILRAGERRSRAIRSLSEIDLTFYCNGQLVPPNHFPVTLLSELDALALREAELEENTIRVDLSWQEQAAAIAELDALRRDQAAAVGQTHTARATASEIVGREAVGSEITRVTEAVVVARHLDDPDVAKAKSTKEALKIIKKKAEAEHREHLAATYDLNQTPHSPLQGSAFDLAAKLPADFFDVILTDPPYGINADQFGDMAQTEHQYTDSLEYALDCYKLVAVEGYRVAKAEAHCYVFLDPRYWHTISLTFAEAGWDVWPTPLIWNKLNGMLPKPEHGPRRTYEMILFASKGGKRVCKVGADLITSPLVTDRDHGAQKPVSLYAELLSRSTIPGSQVVDFFSGSGTIFPAANKARVIATGIEVNPTYYNLGLSRVDQKEDLTDISFFEES